ncbi:uncharacterized protein LOC135694781 [Rhopilema esculentum]|uniref:uncharacterized protein LOC135694781 n=1 Tax=Rhopilema esculentum TaxID=499914 RepID=UPI0031DE8684
MNEVSHADLESNDSHAEIPPENNFDIKPEIRLPMSDQEWLLANKYFHSIFSNISVNASTVDPVIQLMIETIYDYFKETCVTIECCNKDLKEKHANLTAKNLKKELRTLKHSYAPLIEIKYVSNLLHNKIKKQSSPTKSSSITNHDRDNTKNFWNYVKRTLQYETSALPTFSVAGCTEYFVKAFSAIAPNKHFTIPSWIPTFNEPSYSFDLEPPSYKTITSIIRRMKASTSPCPLEKISIICFKQNPYLCSFLTEIICVVWLSGKVPSEWKKASLIKKNSSDDPSKFRPITFASCLRDSIFTFLKHNGFIEHQIQKGFTSKVSGTLEHTAMMSHLINKANIEQRSLVVSLLDLKNAFGDVQHKLIPAILAYHQIPSEIQSQAYI